MSDNKKNDDATYEGVLSDDSVELVNGGFHYNIRKRILVYTDNQNNQIKYHIFDINQAVNYSNNLRSKGMSEEEVLPILIEKGYIRPIE